MRTTRCDQCEAAVINGVYCHEQGCPRQRATDPDYRGDTEPPVLECEGCGYQSLIGRGYTARNGAWVPGVADGDPCWECEKALFREVQ